MSEHVVFLHAASSHGIWNRRQQRERRVVRLLRAGGRSPPGRKPLRRCFVGFCQRVGVQVQCGCAALGSLWRTASGPACSRGRPRRASHPSGSVGHENQHPHAGTAPPVGRLLARRQLPFRWAEFHLRAPEPGHQKYDLDAIYVSGPGHGGPSVVANTTSGHLQRDLPPHQPKRGRPAETLFAVFVSRRDSQPRLAGVSGLDS